MLGRSVFQKAAPCRLCSARDAHIYTLGTVPSPQWFLCVFVNFLPIEACLRVWDTLFYYRSPTVLFK